MTTDGKREALIEEAARAMRPDLWGNVIPDSYGQVRRDRVLAYAEAALAVFEQANTPTDDEREAYLPAGVYNRLMAHLLAGGRESLLLAGEVQSLTGASALRRRPVRGEPTDDERLAVEAINSALTRRWPGAATEKALYDAAVLARRALLCRPVQGEPRITENAARARKRGVVGQEGEQSHG